MKTASASMTVRRRAKGIDNIQVKYIASNAATEDATDTEKNMPLNQIPLIYWSNSTGYESLTAAKPYLWRADTVTYTDKTTYTTYTLFSKIAADAEAEAIPSTLNVKLRPNKLVKDSYSQVTTIKMYYAKSQCTITSATVTDEGERQDSTTGITFGVSVDTGTATLTIYKTESKPLDIRGSSQYLTERYCTVNVVGLDSANNEHLASCRICVQGIVSTTYDPIDVSDLFKNNATQKTTISCGTAHGMFSGGAPLYITDKNGSKVSVEWVYSSTYSSANVGTIAFKAYGVPTSPQLKVFIAPVNIGETSSYISKQHAQELTFSGTISSDYATDMTNIFN